MFFRRRAPPVLPPEFPEADPVALRTELERRLGGVQRHRLLQGFPMAPMMAEASRLPPLKQDKGRRPLIVGVIPHTFCVPAVKGCGFCTFPHEALQSREMLPLAVKIARNIQRRVRHTHWQEVPAIYLGGGTANLTPTPALAIILGALQAFAGTAQEITLEGVPRFFTAEQLSLLTGADLGRVRISMGVQTFDEGWLQKMGRQNIGSPAQVEAALALAQEHGAGSSIDLLLNLPGQPREAMVSDVERAIALGVDQVCLYHLVLRASLPVPWAKDAELLAALPDNEAAFDGWRAARAVLLEAGFVQRTLTNFERPGAESFVYEPLSFQPHRCDAMGFGPGSISGINFGTDAPAMKWIDAPVASEWLGEGAGWRIYLYDRFEDALMQLTRGLALLRVPTDEGALASHGEAFAPELAVLEEAGLLRREQDVLALTERGMFYADSVAGLLAWRTVQYRAAVGLNEPAHHAMG